jgi:hypothetical protein
MAFARIAQIVDLLATAFVFGACVWFFFVQSPPLLKAMGRDKFVPIQMRLTALLFQALTVTLIIALAASALHSSPASWTTLSLAAAVAAVLINKFVVLPQAFRAGGQSRVEAKSAQQSDPTVASFASEGLGNRTRTLHRLVVAFVIVMLAAVVTHAVLLLAAA